MTFPFLRIFLGVLALPGFLWTSSETPTLAPLDVVGREPTGLPWRDDPELRLLSFEDLPSQQGLPVDEILGQVPGVRLFRRDSSSRAHPTTQGMTLRNIGPNGAGRALVLRDGVPQNDPFGGWVSWSALRGISLEQVAVIPPSGGGLFGNQALAGTVRLTTASQEPKPFSGSVFFSIGSRDRIDASLVSQSRVGDYLLSLEGAVLDTDGFHAVPEDRRGPIDRPLSLELDRFRVSLDGPLGEEMDFAWGVSRFSERRINGSPEATNTTRGWDTFLRLASREGERNRSWEMLLYHQDRDFRNQFTSLSEDRATERPVLNQFDVPGQGWGGSLFIRGNHSLGRGGSWTVGGDFRHLSGETHEDYRNLGNGFTRRRQAGGDTLAGGVFGEALLELTEQIRLEAGIRLDYWQLREGQRTEQNLETEAVLTQDNFPNRSGEPWTGRLTLRRSWTDFLETYVSLYQSFRLPSLNEFFRPFRVVNDITEANPSLQPEVLQGIEWGLSWSSAEGDRRLRTNIYGYELQDGITNVTLREATESAFFSDLCGFVPLGGSCRQRQNVDSIEGLGWELQWEQIFREQFFWVLRYQFSRSRFIGSPALLVGNTPAQSPRHSAWTSLRWEFHPGWQVRGELEYLGESYEDDHNQRILEAALVSSLEISWEVRSDFQVFGRVDNLTDEVIPTRIDGSGNIELAEPRSWQLGGRFRW